MPLPNTRYTLLRRLGEPDDPAAWAEFCEVYEPAIRRIAGRYGLQDADAREVTQEVLLTVSRKLSMFDPAAGGRFRSWLAAIARNTTVDLLRKNRRTVCGGSTIRRQIPQRSRCEATRRWSDGERLSSRIATNCESSQASSGRIMLRPLGIRRLTS